MKFKVGDVVRFIGEDDYMTTGDLYVVRLCDYGYLYTHTNIGGEYYLDSGDRDFELVLREKL
jgi:hypothetical protein